MLSQAIAELQSGQPSRAVSLLQEFLAQQPGHKHALRLLAIAYSECGNLGAAEVAFRRVLELDRDSPESWRDYALCLHKSKQLDAAHAAMSQALNLAPGNTGFYLDLGRILFDQGKLEQAASVLQRGLQLEPGSPQLNFELGVILHKLGNLKRARQHLQASLASQPRNPSAWSHLGGVLFKLLLLDEAEAAFRRELALTPNSISALSHLGNVLLKKGASEGALECYQKALSIDSSRASNWFNIGNAQSRLHQFQRAEESLLQCLELQPNHADANSELAATLLAQGRTSEAIEKYRTACSQESKPTVYSNYLYALHMLEPPDPAAELEALKVYEQRFSIRRCAERPPRELADTHRIRVGWVSPDFRQHSVSFFLEPIFEHYDRSRFEFFCYYVGWQRDQVTQRLQNQVDHWADVAAASDSEIANQIHDDQIDCLIDLAGHTGHNRLPVFTARPAPVQMTFLGYSGSTGLSSFDYLITDARANPPASQAFCSEKLLYLPDSYFCYRPPVESPAVAPLPMDHHPWVTFGCFNNYAKVSSMIRESWAQILLRVPQSRLLLKNTSLVDRPTVNELHRFFESRGIAKERVLAELPQATTAEHLAIYNQIDIALDTYPYNGATTTCEALWMGAPVISLSGPTHVSRMGLSILSAIGWSNFSAASVEEYVDLACKLASSPDQLRHLRKEIRHRMQSSPLMDEIGYTRALEAQLSKAVQSTSATTDR